MMIRRIKRAKEMALKSYRPPQPSTVERNLVKFIYKTKNQIKSLEKTIQI